MPYSYFENGEHRGIVHDIIAQMERDLGITFDVRETPTNAALFAQLDDGGADVMLDFYSDFNWARQHGVHITNPYLISSYVTVRRRGQALPAAPRVAAPRSRNFTHQYIEQTYPAEQISYYDTDAQCLAAVNDGSADLALVKSVSANALLYNGLFYRLMAENNVVFSHGTSLTVSDRLDPIFVRILNKEIAHLDPAAVQSAINEETSVASDKSPLASLLYRYPQESFLVITALFLLLLAAVILTLYVRRSHLAAITRLIVLCALPERMMPKAAAAAIPEHFSSVPLGGVVTRVRYHMSFLPITRQNMTNVSHLLGESIASLNYAREHDLPFVLFDQAMHDRFL